MSEKRILIPWEDMTKGSNGVSQAVNKGMNITFYRIFEEYCTRPIIPEDVRGWNKWTEKERNVYRELVDWQRPQELADASLNIALRPTPEEDKPREVAAERFLAENYSKIRAAACNLAAAALHVIQEYDGVHRMALALSEFTKALANEGGRDHRKEDK